jgi:hypothetical protein
LRSARAPWSNEAGDDDAEGHDEEEGAVTPTNVAIRIMIVAVVIAFVWRIIPRNLWCLTKLPHID